MNHETIILSLGGSIIVPEEINISFLKQFKKFILKYIKKGFRFVIICGGGKTCRKYQSAAKKISRVSDEQLDWLGIEVTKTNAEFVKDIFGAAADSRIMANPLKKMKTNKKIIMGAGWKPGCSTDNDAVLAAKTYNAEFIVNMFDLDCVYTKDPRKFREAKPIKSITWDGFIKIIGEKRTPGMHGPFDPVASRLAKKLQIKTIILKGTNLNNLGKLLDKKKFKGTTIY